MNKFLSFLVSRQCLSFVALLLVALLIWFVGPFVAFGGLKPLAGAGMRILVIALLLAGVLLWLADWSTSVVFVALLCLLIWHASPLLAFGHATPFVPESARVIAIAVVLTAFLIHLAFRLLQKMRTDADFLKNLIEFGSKKHASPAAGQLAKVNAAVAGALARLKAMRTGARGLGRLFQGKRYLYELPWFITLGSGASGKTSALLNAGLSFPLAAQMQRATARLANQGGSVDWWLTNDAVLIDTAGHYTRHGTSRHVLPQPPAPASSGHPEGAESAGKPHARRSDEPATGEGRAAAATSASTASADFPPGEQGTWRQIVDQAEWLGFLRMLRKHRPRAPINGALLTVDVAELMSDDENARNAEAAALRARLADLRTELGIRFPVYLLITKMDRLPGFSEYFSSLTTEGRAQTWGFTLPYGKETIAYEGIHARCTEELGALAARLAAGVNARLLEEHETLRRRRLAAFAEEFLVLTRALGELINRVFLDSRYDDTQRHSTLRGVYFTSAAQTGSEIAAEPRTVMQRLAAAIGCVPATAALAPRHEGGQSFFLHDLLTKIVFPDAHLVHPNLRWEYRSRTLCLIGHALALLLFGWLAIGLRVSMGNNGDYLDAIGHKTAALASRVSQLYKAPKPEAVPDALTEARHLPAYPGLDLSDPDGAWRFGLYTPPDIVAESHRTYDALEDNLLLPQIVKRIEAVLAQAIASRDPKTAYDALRVYLMLYDKAKFDAAQVEAWVLDDWAKTDSAAVFGGRASMIAHVEQLFSGERAVQSPLIRNDGLIRQARAFLDGSNATQRLYERAKAAMQKEAPDEFTLLKAVGPQAGTVFARASDAPLSRGVPGLFTFDGYRRVFDKRLPEFVQIARDDDAWVMGRAYLGEAQKKTAAIGRAAADIDDPLTEAIRRQYLMEYAQQWDAFLGDIRTVTGTSLAFNLLVLRSFAAPDSPLARLARAAVHETTLTQPIASADRSVLQKATDSLSQTADKAPGIHAEERVERELVDSRFAGLREMATGSAEARTETQPSAAQAIKTGLDGVANLLNDYYTALTVADDALSNNSMPPASDAAAKLKMAANTMPAPFRAVLLELSAQGSREVNRGIGQLLSRQMEAMVGDICRLTIEGNYPFAADSKRDVRIDDFTRVFARGGVIDDFFTKTLAPFVDTSTRPWRYKTLPGATEPVQGPDLEPFQHAKAIREIFFGDPGEKQLAWKADIRTPELDPTITSLMIDVDGQTTLYQHGPVAPFTVSWPGPRGGVHVEITASPRIRPDTSTVSTDGPWALLRLLQKGHLIDTATPGRSRVALDFDGRKAVLDIASAGSIANPLTSNVLKTFQCPVSMPTFSLADTGPPPGLPPASPRAPPATETVHRQYRSGEPVRQRVAHQVGVRENK
ncbi:type VI secretion protein VasK [Burkholderia sp. ABCPW 14]|uniref:type VI secretion system membrane subunit TssM n=1 Tax=Burkholderia sp. ABCPW 14 TaxID=1637860 RepID=UPI000770D600|nr:type VI secretion system membrane subunit TssM [Burkholderia sp. ABCPW 14]KVD77271.1 type VI secretion protein VasK [Burkholderia sp. ABCPW 14]